MRLADFDYQLPPELIAQHPHEPRDQARLLLVRLAGQELSHHRVAELPELLSAGDRLVLNDTKVIPARLTGQKASGGAIEVLLIRPETTTPPVWRCLIRGKVHVGTQLEVAGVTASITAVHADGERSLRFADGTEVLALAEARGEVPLPPYIRRPTRAADSHAYQTVFARTPGSVAAPTASLHFTQDLLQRLQHAGIQRSHLTLAVGPGTFKPVQSEDLASHQMHAEYCQCPASTVAEIEATRAAGGRVIAVGTTVVRSLESARQAGGGRLVAFAGDTRIFLHPPQRLASIDGLLTNFHLPRSTLLMLVACLTGIDFLQEIYATAIRQRYRFYSYGDAMLLLP